MQYTEDKLDYLVELENKNYQHECSSCGEFTFLLECSHCGYDESENLDVYNSTL